MTYSRILADWKSQRKMEMLWRKQSALWTGKDESRWLGWLDIVKQQQHRLGEFAKIQKQFMKYETVAVLGMGGSSLCPEVLAKTFEAVEGFPRLFILDSTDPLQVKSFQKKLSLDKNCFIVSSKSGSTLEPNIFLEYFHETAPGHFIAITDPGSSLEKRARNLKFLDVFYGRSSSKAKSGWVSLYLAIRLAHSWRSLDPLLPKFSEKFCLTPSGIRNFSFSGHP